MAPSTRFAPWWHLAVLLGASVAFEALFIRHGLNLLDEGWPLYAASGLREGGTLYRDVFFIFPPGHLLAGWLGSVLAPPGVVVARIVYAAFAVAACLSVYLLGRRVMPASFALLGGCLLAVAAPESHFWHTLFGYRYFAFSAFALLAFAGRVQTGQSRFLALAGALVGLGLCFRITPALAATAGLGIGVLASSRDWRSWLRDGLAFLLGLSLVVGPVAGWLIASVGADVLWRELLVRPVVMTDLQSLALPPLELPDVWGREPVTRLFEAAQFRLYLLLYGAYFIALAVGWARAVARRERFEHALLLAIVSFGGIYFLRSLGRSDFHHLYSALPPVCLVLAHLLSVGVRLGTGALALKGPTRGAVCGAACAAVFSAWVLLMGSDTYLDPGRRGGTPVKSLGGAVSLPWAAAVVDLDRTVKAIAEASGPGEQLLDLSAHPLIYLLSSRRGPGYLDVVMPGTFLDADEERGFLRRLEASPPALVLLRVAPFDGRHTLESSAPRVVAWVEANYQAKSPVRRPPYVLLHRRTEVPRRR